MHTFEAIRQRRSIRKFSPDSIPVSCLKEILDVSRLYPSGGNLQPIRFALVTAPELTDRIFSDLRWAMYLPGYTIANNERPTAYVILLGDENVRKKCDYDVGAASTTVMLAAADKGLATCPIGNYNSTNLSALLKLPENLQPELVIAMGYPAQESKVVPMADTIRYTQDANGTFLVPKWNLEDILVFDN